MEYEYDHYLIIGCAADPLQRGNKMSNQKTDHELIIALNHFEAEHGKLTLTAGPIDVCATYKLAKPVLQAILPFLSFIPIIGARVVPVITALMVGLDSYCKLS